MTKRKGRVSSLTRSSNFTTESSTCLLSTSPSPSLGPWTPSHLSACNSLENKCAALPSLPLHQAASDGKG